MNDCPLQDRLSSYHDGQLDADEAGRMREHLPTCPSCAADLAALQELSASISASITDERIEPHELAGIHAAVDQAMDEQAASGPLLHTAGLLAALAASILIVSSVWLMDLPAGQPSVPRSVNNSVAMAPEWERVAITLRAEPRPSLMDDDSLFSPRYAAAAQFMVNNLTPTE